MKAASKLRVTPFRHPSRPLLGCYPDSKGRKTSSWEEMTKQSAEHPANDIRLHRHRAGLTQQELEHALGYGGKGSVARYERLQDVPPLSTAIGLEIIFHTPVGEIFCGLRDALIKDIEARLALFENSLGQRSARDPDANATAKKLMWLSQRKSADGFP